MTSNGFARGSLVLSLLLNASCGGEVAGARAFPAGEGDGGSETSVRVGAPDPVSEGGGRPKPARTNCPAGFVLEGDVCAGWVQAGSASCDSAATRLNDGRVICTSGGDTLVFDPLVGNWSKGNGLHTVRSGHTATLLADGRVLVAGGTGADGTTLASTEIFTPSDGSWHDAAPMTTPRQAHAAALLGDGRVLVMGGGQGDSNEIALSSTEIFDPATDKWTPDAGLSGPRIQPSASTMADGTILIFGGGRWLPTQAGLIWNSTAESYDAAAGAWQPAPTLPGASLLFGFSSNTATVLSDGSVLGVGIPGVGPGAALLDPARTAWGSTAPALAAAEPIASILPNGNVLVVGTDIYAVGPSYAAAYDPTHDTWMPTVRPSGWYYGGTALLLLDGSVLAVCGNMGGGIAERYVLRQPSP